MANPHSLTQLHRQARGGPTVARRESAGFGPTSRDDQEAGQTDWKDGVEVEGSCQGHSCVVEEGDAMVEAVLRFLG